MARLDAERQLRSALRALEHMELALKLSGPHITEYLKDEIMPDVRKLKSKIETVLHIISLSTLIFPCSLRIFRRMRGRSQIRRQPAHDNEKCSLCTKIVFEKM